MVQHYATRVEVNIEGFGAHSLRATTAATNALDQEWLGHANIATEDLRVFEVLRTRLGDPARRKATEQSAEEVKREGA